MQRKRLEDTTPPWGALPTELVQVIGTFLQPADLAAASLVCRSWRAAACALVTHLTLPLNHPLLIAGPVRGWEEAVARQFGCRSLTPPSPQAAQQQHHHHHQQHHRQLHEQQQQQQQQPPDGTVPSLGSVGAGGGTTAESLTPSCVQEPSGSGSGSGRAAAAAAPVPLPRLRTDFPSVTHITLVHNSLLHRSQVHAALSSLRALWPGVRGLSVHDSVTWDLPLDYSALGVLTHITSLELLFQGQGGMDEAGQPMYRASMPHLCRLSQLKELCMKWIIGYDVDSFLDFNEVYDLLASFVRHSQLRSLQFGGENINAEGARHLASITSLETLNLVCDARPASPIHLLDLLTMPRLTRLELMHVCPDHAWNAEPLPGEPADPLVELATRTAALTSSPLRCLALSLSPRCQAMISRALPLLPHLHSLSVRVTSSDEEEALCAAFRAMLLAPSPALPQDPGQPPAGAAGPAGAAAGAAAAALVGSPISHAAASAAGQPSTAAPSPPPLRSLRLETAELGAELIASLASLTALTSLQLPRGLPTGETVEYTVAPTAAAVAAAADPAAAAVVQNKYCMSHLSSLGRLTNLRRLMVQLDSPADTASAFIDGGLVSVLVGLPLLESLHLSTWNLMAQDPTAEALGPYPERPQDDQEGAEGGRKGASAAATATATAAAAAATLAIEAPVAATDGTGAGAAADGGLVCGTRRGRAGLPCLPPLPTWAWKGLRSLSLTHWPCVYGKLREVGPPQAGRCYAVRWDDLPSSLEALLLVRCQLTGNRLPPRLRHLWLADCVCSDLPQLLSGMTGLETLVLRWPSTQEEQETNTLEAAARQRTQLVAAVASLKGLRTLGLGGIRCCDVPSLAPLSLLRHLMLEPLQPQRPAGEVPSAQRDLALLDRLMALPAGALAGVRTLWLPNWAMPIKQLLQWQQMLQAAMPLVVLRVTEYDVVWTVPNPVMHVAQVEAPSSLGGGGCSRRHAGLGLDGQELEWWHIGCWTVQ